jgi:hypothetical protein
MDCNLIPGLPTFAQRWVGKATPHHAQRPHLVDRTGADSIALAGMLIRGSEPVIEPVT